MTSTLTADTSPMPAARLDWARLRPKVLPIVGVVVVFALWEFASRANIIPRRYLPPSTTILAELFRLLGRQAFWVDMGLTLEAWALGLLLAVVVGIPVGWLVGSSRIFADLTRVVFEFLRPVPPVALIPVFVLLYGTSMTGAVLLGAFASVWPLVVQTSFAVRLIDPVARDSARTMQLGPFRRFRSLMLPATAPVIASGIRIASGINLVLVVTAGIIVGNDGVGKSITQAANASAFSLMYAYVIATGLLGMILNFAMLLAERQLIYWVPGGRLRKGPK